MAAVASPLSAQSKAGEGTIVLGKEIMPKDTTRQTRFKNHLIVPKGGWQLSIRNLWRSRDS